MEARYEEGVLRPVHPLALRPGERVNLIVVRRPDPDRWNMHRLTSLDQDEADGLAERGLGAWADALDKEDRS